LSIDGWILFGPLDEYDAITGAGFLPMSVFGRDILILVTDFMVSLQNTSM